MSIDRSRGPNRAFLSPIAAGAVESSAAGYEIDAMFERRDKLVEHIQALIDEHGEGAVLFHSER